MCIRTVYTLLKVVGYYDLSILSITGCVSKQIGWGWVCGVSSIQFYMDFWKLFNFAKPLRGWFNQFSRSYKTYIEYTGGGPASTTFRNDKSPDKAPSAGENNTYGSV